MKTKRLLKFYFFADKLNGALDRVIEANAMKACGDALSNAEKILSVIEVKKELSVLWSYLDGVISRLSEGERSVLEFYASLRAGIKKLSGEQERAIRRVAVKFTRRARFLGRYEKQIELLNEYRMLL